MKKIVAILSFLSFFFLTGHLSGCAKANYAKQSTPATSESLPQEKPNTIVASCPHVFDVGRYCLDWQWETKPTSKTQGSLVFKTYRLNSFDQSMVLVDLSQIPELILWMPGMGHGSTPTQVIRLDVGTYRAENVFFVMPGSWELQFQIKSEKKVVDKVYVAISI